MCERSASALTISSWSSSRRGTHVGVIDLQPGPTRGAAPRCVRPHRQRAQRRALTQMQLLHRLDPVASEQRLHDRRRPNSRWVEQRDHRRGAAEVGARRRESARGSTAQASPHEYVDHVWGRARVAMRRARLLPTPPWPQRPPRSVHSRVLPAAGRGHRTGSSTLAVSPRNCNQRFAGPSQRATSQSSGPIGTRLLRCTRMSPRPNVSFVALDVVTRGDCGSPYRASWCVRAGQAKEPWTPAIHERSQFLRAPTSPTPREGRLTTCG